LMYSGQPVRCTLGDAAHPSYGAFHWRRTGPPKTWFVDPRSPETRPDAGDGLAIESSGTRAVSPLGGGGHPHLQFPLADRTLSDCGCCTPTTSPELCTARVPPKSPPLTARWRYSAAWCQYRERAESLSARLAGSTSAAIREPAVHPRPQNGDELLRFPDHQQKRSRKSRQAPFN